MTDHIRRTVLKGAAAAGAAAVMVSAANMVTGAEYEVPGGDSAKDI